MKGTMTSLLRTTYLFLSALTAFVSTDAFIMPTSQQLVTLAAGPTSRNLVELGAKKKRRRRKNPPPGKKPPVETSQPPVEEAKASVAVEPVIEPKPIADVSMVQPEDVVKQEVVQPVDDFKPTPGGDASKEEEGSLSDILDVAKYKFEPDDAITKDIQDEPKAAQEQADGGAIPLPDIKQALRRKEIEKELERIEDEKEAQKVKIKRSDKNALAKLLEQQPYADADDSFFEEEEYTTISALLGERAKPFLGIPSGPLQVGHFIGALVIVLMAFVEYPGFPLTNLPSPLRGALQGGLATVYGINLVLAVLAVFKAAERDQPVPLWVAKTFSVGGLAYDQLTQLPTTEEIERAKAVKGKRALKNRRKR